MIDFKSKLKLLSALQPFTLIASVLATGVYVYFNGTSEWLETIVAFWVWANIAFVAAEILYQSVGTLYRHFGGKS